MNADIPTERKRFNNAIKTIPKSIRGHVVAMIGELIGTLSFIFIAFAGTQTANVASNVNTGDTIKTTTVQKTPQQLLYISLSFGFSLAVNAWVFSRVSGGLFNPAVTLGMVLIGAITWIRGILLFIMQMAGAIAGAYMVDALFTGGLNTSTTLQATTSVAQGVLIEMLLTTLLCFTIFMLAAEKHVGNFIAPVGIGLALFISELVGVFWTGGSLNPARSFAPAVVVGFKSTQWVYWVGPICGSILAVIIYSIIKALEYETANADPEAPMPSGPAAQPSGDPDVSTLRNDNDLERGYTPSKEYSDREVSTFARTNGAANPPVPLYKPESQNSARTRQTQQIIPAVPVQTQDYNQPAYPQQMIQTVQPAAPLQYSSQPALGDESRWNAQHTANARANTHTLQ